MNLPPSRLLCPSPTPATLNPLGTTLLVSSFLFPGFPSVLLHVYPSTILFILLISEICRNGYHSVHILLWSTLSGTAIIERQVIGSEHASYRWWDSTGVWMSNQQKEVKPESKVNGQGTQSRDLNSTIYQFKSFTFSSFPKDAQYQSQYKWNWPSIAQDLFLVKAHL